MVGLIKLGMQLIYMYDIYLFMYIFVDNLVNVLVDVLVNVFVGICSNVFVYSNHVVLCVCLDGYLEECGGICI